MSQKNDPDDDENFDAEHSVQSGLLARLNFPASHDEHALLSDAVAGSTNALPSAHATQTSLVDPEYWPGAQAVHDALDAALNDPAGQDVQAEDSLSVADKTFRFPAPQLVHSALLSPEYRPT